MMYCEMELTCTTRHGLKIIENGVGTHVDNLIKILIYLFQFQYETKNSTVVMRFVQNHNLRTKPASSRTTPELLISIRQVFFKKREAELGSFIRRTNQQVFESDGQDSDSPPPLPLKWLREQKTRLSHTFLRLAGRLLSSLSFSDDLY